MWGAPGGTQGAARAAPRPHRPGKRPVASGVPGRKLREPAHLLHCSKPDHHPQGLLVLRSTLALALIALPAMALADRITEMPRTERCVYKARLSIAGYYYFIQGKPRADVPVAWHGDETEYETDFINRTLDDAYARLEALRGAEGRIKASETQFGDQIYEACMSGSES